MQKYVFYLNGLSCAGCADIIGKELQSVESFSGVVVNFFDKELQLYTGDLTAEADILNQIRAIVKKIEPDIEVVPAFHKKVGTRFRDNIISSLRTWDMILLLIGALLFLLSFFIKPELLRLSFYLISYLLIGRQVIIGASRKLFSKYIFNEHFLMTVATFGAIALGEYAEAVAVMLFYQIGRFFEIKVVEYSQSSINEILKLRPEYANLKQADQVIKVSPEKVEIGQIIVIKPGERVPLDCEIISGTSSFDHSMLTGESMPITAGPKTVLPSGSVNLNNPIEAKVIRDLSHSTIAKAIDLVKMAKSKKTRTERFITRFASIYTPIVLALALLIAVLPSLLIPDASYQTWLYRSLIFLVISCPCALVISVPLSFFAGLAVLIKKGVLSKGAIYLESLAHCKTVVLDKTGTLTIGKPEIDRILPGKAGNPEDLLYYAHLAETGSNHPLAVAIVSAYHSRSGIHNAPEQGETLNRLEFAGKGVKVSKDNLEILAGSPAFLLEQSITIEDSVLNEDDLQSVVCIAVNGDYYGMISFSDKMRAKMPLMVKKLHSLGIEKVVMLTGDAVEAAAKIAAEAGIDIFKAKMSPEDKVREMEKLRAENQGKLIFVGDGINDAAAMALADVGIAMGGIGAAASIESADVVLQTDELEKLPSVVEIARKTLNNARQNIVLAIGIKIIFLMLGALGLITVWGAVFADVGVTVLAVLNSLRLLRLRD